MKRGDIPLVFNSKKWDGKDRGDNSQFWERAEILRVSGKGRLRVATVRWANGDVTKGHFVNMMKK